MLEKKLQKSEKYVRCGRKVVYEQERVKRLYAQVRMIHRSSFLIKVVLPNHNKALFVLKVQLSFFLSRAKGQRLFSPLLNFNVS